jgi:HAD superfamily hydrolase (TIGR01549 family)
MPAARIETVLFDLDGTIIHSEAVAARALLGVFERHGIRLDPRAADTVIGRTWESAFEILARTVPLTVDPRRLLDETIQEYRIRLRTEVVEVPGASEAVRLLSGSFRIGLVSGSYRAEIETALQQLGIRQHFEVVLGAEDYGASKPSPEGYELALRKLGSGPGGAVVFEDSEAGIESGLAAGATVVAVRQCRSLPEHSPWHSRVHAAIDDWKSVTPQWVQALSVRGRSGSRP